MAQDNFMYESDREYESTEEEEQSSSESEEEYDDLCYYCSAFIDDDLGVPFYDKEPSTPRWYCSSCMLYIHSSDIDSP